MARTKSFARLLPFVIAALLACAATASSADGIATAIHQPTLISWQPSIAYESVSLRVTGPGGFVHDRDFGSGVPVFAPAGEALADGHYTYELVFGKKRSAALAAALAGNAFRASSAAFDPSLHDQIEALRATVSGTFLVLGGRIVSPDLVEPQSLATKRAAAAPVAITPKDIPFADDVIVQGSLCVGLDCVVDEAFGFDTIRLKENNTRIKFDDTSVSAGFPANDWQLTANDSASGGASKFSIEDVTGAKIPLTVTAGAPTDSLFISSSGKVGFRTATPVLDLHARTSDTPAIRLEQTNAGGFTAQTWDIGANEANFFVRDVTGGSRLPFRIRPLAPTSSIDISAAGHVGIGTAGPNLGGVARALTVSTPNPATSPGDLAALELQGGQSADSAFGVVRFYNRSNLNAQIAGAREGADNTASLRFLTANAGIISEKVRILHTGFVGIGTSAPTSKLHVVGDATVTGNMHVLGTCCGPDYVFDPGYRLASIEDQGAYMRTNRHLPAVGPARTTEDGHAIINVFAQANGMLEELEKAHLYIEGLHREIQALKAQGAARDAEIREELAALRRLLAN
jgi:hypothetical protein